MLKSTYKAPAGLVPLAEGWTQHNAPDGEITRASEPDTQQNFSADLMQDDHTIITIPRNNLHIPDRPIHHLKTRHLSSKLSAELRNHSITPS